MRVMSLANSQLGKANDYNVCKPIYHVMSDIT